MRIPKHIGIIPDGNRRWALENGLQKPMLRLCPDDMATRRLQEELHALLGYNIPILPTRELTLHDTAVVSRAWEQKRLRLLYDFAKGNCKVLIASWDAMTQRTMPRQTLLDAAFTLQVGQEYDTQDLLSRLSCSGYTRCAMVEGPGQFSVRGGIIDIFSPAADRPFRAEFFGDELDTMGYFDPDTQRRTDNIMEQIVLPVGETQPRLHPNGLDGLCDDLRGMIARQKRRKTVNEDLIRTLEKDLEKYENNLSNPASDRYMALIYLEMAPAADYLPQDALFLICDQSALHRTARSRSEEIR